MSHRYHPDPEMDDPQGAILFDDCPRCEQQADDPRHLDHDKLLRAWGHAISTEWGRTTKNERVLFDGLYKVRVMIERLKEAGITL